MKHWWQVEGAIPFGEMLLALFLVNMVGIGIGFLIWC